jgi:glycosyltransferase involved in cell wall biosynthesis
MLRVLTLSTLYPDRVRPGFGGFVARQTRALADQPDVTVQVVAPLGLPIPSLRRAAHRQLADLPLTEEFDGLRISRPRFSTWPGPAGRGNGRRLGKALIRFVADLRRGFPFDVIDAEFFWPDGVAAIALGDHFGVPVSIKARGSDINFWGKVPAVRRRIVDAAKAADGLLAVSAALADRMAAIGIDRKRITVHYTGIDRELFHPVDRAAARAALQLDEPLFVTVGTLNRNKGQSLAIDAIAALPGTTLVLVGDGPDREKLAAQAAERGVSDRVRLAGQISPEQLAPLIAAADALVQPSTNEGLANVWVEALACGTPVIATRAGGIAEVLDRPAAGRIVERDAAALATAMKAILARPPDREEVRAAAARFSWDINGVALAAHLARLVAERH